MFLGKMKIILFRYSRTVVKCYRGRRSQAYAICGPFLFACRATLLRIGAKEIYGYTLLFYALA